MSRDPYPEGISLEDQRILRLFKITNCVLPQALLRVFRWGCKKAPNESLEEYLIKKKKMSTNDYKKRFDSQMQQKITADPSGKTYDVTLLWTCIKLGCDGLAQGPWKEGDHGVESLCTTVKNYRNRLIHEGAHMCDDAAMKTWCTNITKVLEKLLLSAGFEYSIPDEYNKKEIEDIKEQIKRIMDAPLEDPVKLHQEMLKLREEQKDTINEEGKKELSEKYTDISKIGPASFVTGKESMHVKKVFTELELTCEKGKNVDKTYDVLYNKLLRLKTDEGQEPAVITVEGDAGTGKTTLSKLILSDWAESKSTFEGIGDYDLVLHVEGKNKHISSYSELIQVLMPKASCKLADDDLVRSVLQLKVLLIMDGGDELNAESEKLLRELSDKQIPGSSGKLQLLITTRPSKLSDLLKIVKPFSHFVVKTTLKGISINKRVEFVSKLHDEMIKEKQSNKETQKLIDLMKQSQSRLGEHYRLPLNLTLLTYLWASDPNKVNPETTATGLYVAFMELLESRLLERLQNKVGFASLQKDKGIELIREFLQELYRVSLDTLPSGFMQLSDDSTKALKKKCKELPFDGFEDMTEAFLVVEKEWTSAGYKTDLSVPHKSILEFYAANGFMTYMNNMNDAASQKDRFMAALEKSNVPEEKREEKLQKILIIINEDSNPEDPKSLTDICHKHLKTDKDLTMYQNMFLHLTGLLAHQYPDKFQDYVEELVGILSNAGFKTKLWLNVLVEAKFDNQLAGLLAPYCNDGFLTVQDGHMGAALALFKHLNTKTTVRIFIENEVSYIPHLDDMLLQLSKRDCDVYLNLKHQWNHPKYGFSDDHLHNLLHGEDDDYQCRLIEFSGHLKTLSNLPKSLKRLRITFASTEHAQQLLKELPDLLKNSKIEFLGIHVMPDVQPDGLSPLPVVNNNKMNCGDLWLANAPNEWKAMCKVVQALQPVKGKFRIVRFPENNLTADHYKMIITELGKLKVEVGRIWLRSSIITYEEKNQLSKLAENTLGCELDL